MPDGLGQLMEGVYGLLNARFPIEVILHHLHEGASGAMEIEAQHLVLAIHTAIEAWNRFFGFEHWVDDHVWKRHQERLRHGLLPDDVYEDLGDDVAANLRSAFRHANRTTTTWRQEELFRALEIDVSDGDNRRALAFRDELLHNGYFLRRWFDLSDVERQARVHDIERLRRLALLIVFRLTGYRGMFMNPITYQPEQVEPCALPDLFTAHK